MFWLLDYWKAHLDIIIRMKKEKLRKTKKIKKKNVKHDGTTM
jgi:hypothetical protein